MIFFYLLGYFFSVGIKQEIRAMLESKLDLKAAKVLAKFNAIDKAKGGSIDPTPTLTDDATAESDPFESVILKRHANRRKEKSEINAKEKAEAEMIVKQHIIPKLRILEKKTNSYYRSYVLGVSARNKSFSGEVDSKINCHTLKKLSEIYSVEEV